jgi:hypothetical protein
MEHSDLELYIQIRDGQPHEHPIFADNFKLAFPEVDIHNLPADQFARFIRIAPPEVDVYEVYEGVTYQWDGDIVKDVHAVRAMTDEERVQKDLELAAQKEAEEEVKVLALHASRTKRCRENADTASDAIEKQLWLNCLAAHEAWELHSINPTTPPFPLFPKQDESGNWVAP